VKLDEGASISSITRVISEDAATSEEEVEDAQISIDDAPPKPEKNEHQRHDKIDSIQD
jgi:hypothetical protein